MILVAPFMIMLCDLSQKSTKPTFFQEWACLLELYGIVDNGTFLMF